MFDELGLDLLDNIKNYKSEHVDLCICSANISKWIRYQIS